MLHVFQVSFRHQLWRSGASAAAAVRRRAADAARRGLTGGGDRNCTVDPELEEQFFFLDCSDLQEDLHHEEKDLLCQLSASLAPPDPPPDAGASPQKHLRSLEHQLQVLHDVDLKEAESRIQFQDVDFPLDESAVASTTRKKKKSVGTGVKGEHKIFGTPDVDEPVSNTCCSGCGAVLHCTTAAMPGYLPSEKFKSLQQEGGLRGATCQRCHRLTHHRSALSLQMSREQYRDVVRQIRPLHALVLLVVDLLDLPDSIVPDLPELVGSNKHVVVVGNKVDLLPADSPNYLQRIKRRLAQFCQDAGFGPQVSDVHLISAKTGYGVEALISSLQRSWKYRGDVYLVGSANAGKSTLFNTLLQSDYCKSRASDLIHKATISPWPGTTLNLLRFPIINPTPYRMFRRQERLKAAQEELQPLQRFSREGHLIGQVGRTFQSDRSASEEIFFDPDSLAFGEEEDGDMRRRRTDGEGSEEEMSPNELKDAHWLYDTPGILKEFDVRLFIIFITGNGLMQEEEEEPQSSDDSVSDKHLIHEK